MPSRNHDSPLSHPLQPGVLINERYAVADHLGDGRTGVVYLVRDNLAGERPLALKALRSEDVGSAELAALKCEFESLTRFRHPNLAEVYDFGRLVGTDTCFFTMELVEGNDLFAGTADLDLEGLCERFAQICRALDYLHSRGYVHRDLKPENIIIARGTDGAPVVKLLDFGMLGLAHADAGGGTPHYMAPEVLRGEPAGPGADLYSLGVLLYQSVTRRLPFDGETLEEVIRHHLRTPPPPPPDDANPALVRTLWPVVEKLLSKSPADRHASATEVIDALNQAAGLRLDTDTAETLEGHLSSSPFVGRERELEILRTEWRRLGDDAEANRVVLIAGNTGVGKSRVLREFRYFCQLSGGSFFSSNCRSETGQPYEPLCEILRQALAAAGANTTDIGHDIAELCAAAAEVVGGDVPDVRGGVDPSQVPIRYAEVVLKLLAHLAQQQALVVALDDFQWVSGPAAEAIGYLARNATGERFLVCLLYRSEEMAGTPGQPVVEELAERSAANFNLDPLTGEEISSMVDTMLGAADFPPAFGTQLAADAGGNPLFAIELLRLYAQERTLFRLEGRWHASETALREGGRVPTSLRELVERRLESLPPTAREVVEALAVLGRPASADLLSTMLSVPQQEITSRVRRLGDADAATQDPATGLVELSHSEVGRTVYASLEPAKAQDLHARAVAALETGVAGDVREQVVELATHSLRAEDRERSLRYGPPAAEELKEAFDTDESRRLYEQVLELLDPADPQTEVRVREGLADVYRFVGEPGKALDCCEAAIDVCERLADREALSRLHQIKATTLEGTGRLDDAAAHFRKARELIGDYSPPSHAAAQVCEGLGRVALRRRQPVEALTHFETALAALGDDLDSATCASVYTSLAFAHHLLQQPELALDRLDRSLSIRERIGDYEGLSRSLTNKGQLHRSSGEYARAAECFQQSLEIKLKVGHSEGVAVCHYNLGNLHVIRGDYAEAQRQYEQSLAIRERIEDRAGLFSSLVGLAHVCRQTANYVEALQTLERCLEVQEDLPGTTSAAPHHELSAVYTELGQYESAEKAAREALKIAGAGGDAVNAAHSHVQLARVLRARRQTEAASEALADARRLLEGSGNQEHLSAVALEQARLAHESGDRETASQLLAELEGIESDAGPRTMVVEFLCLRGDLLAEEGRFGEALTDYESAAESAEAMQTPEGLWRSKLGAARMYREQGRYAAEMTCHDVVLSTILRICKQLSEEQDRLTYLASGRRLAAFETIRSLSVRLEDELGD